MDERLPIAPRAGLEGAFPPGAKVILAVSGGPDSMAMAALFRRLARRCRWHLAWAHLNHGLRGAESDLDERFVRSLARRWRVPLQVGRADVWRVARRKKLSVEAAAREKRYRFLERAALKVGAQFVATAHTLDDQAETVLLRLARGAGIRGLRGVLPARPIRSGSGIRLVRPLLRIRKAQLVRFLKRRRIPFRLDHSNLDPHFARNALRLGLLASWVRRDPSIVERLSRLAEGARAFTSALDRRLADLSPSVWEADGTVRIHPGAFRGLPAALQREVLHTCLTRSDLARFAGGTRRHIRLLRGFILGGRQGRALSFPGGCWRREHDGVVWLPAGSQPATPAPLRIDGPGTYRWGKWAFRVSGGGSRIPLFIRARRPGDRIRPAGASGSKKLSDYWIDLKFPRRLRDRWPIIARRGGAIVAVPGFTVRAGATARPGSPAIRIECLEAPAECRRACRLPAGQAGQAGRVLAERCSEARPEGESRVRDRPAQLGTVF